VISINERPRVQVRLNAANVRSGPGEEYSVITVALKDTLLPVIATDRARGWYNVDLGDQTYGWIGSSTVDEIESLDSVPVAATIPAPPQ
jgi:uncharacterized protein YgiM (DUF1202 family)